MSQVITITDAFALSAPPIARARASSSRMYLKYRFLNAVSLLAGDFIALSLSLLSAGYLRSWIVGAPFIPDWSWILLPIWAIGTYLVSMLPSWGLGPVEELRRLTLLLLSVFAITAVALFLSKQSELTSRLTLSFALGICFFLVPLFRIQVKRILIRMGKWGLPVVIYGGGEKGQRVIKKLQGELGLGLNPVAVLHDEADRSQSHLFGVPVLGNTNQIVSSAPAAIVAVPETQKDSIAKLLEGPLAAYRKVIIVPDLAEIPSLWLRTRDMSGIVGLELTSSLLNPFARGMKRLADLSFTIVMAPLWLSICLLVSMIMIVRTRKSPIFKQQRVGLDGKMFNALKFQTMVDDAETVLEEYLLANPELRDEWETSYKLKDDPRVTPLGGLLRRLSIDEMPQFFNVLKGDMSLVGPRPLPIYHHDELSERVQSLRMRVRPGITGMWQISGRSDSGTDGMERWDSYYVRNWSPWLDAVVMIRTIRTVIRGTGAY